MAAVLSAEVINAPDWRKNHLSVDIPVTGSGGQRADLHLAALNYETNRVRNMPQALLCLSCRACTFFCHACVVRRIWV